MTLTLALIETEPTLYGVVLHCFGPLDSPDIRLTPCS